MAKRLGFIQCVSPKKKTRTGGTSFRFKLQDSENTSEDVLGFGDQNHQKLHEFALKQSPVKIKLSRNEAYNSFIFNENCSCTTTGITDVPFPYIQMEETRYGGGASATVDIQTLISATPDGKYYTVQGKVVVGDDELKDCGNNRFVKEDIMLYDSTGAINLRVWMPLAKEVVHRKSYEFTHVKLKRFGGVCLTTPPQTTCKPVTLFVEVPDNVSFGTVATLKIEQFEQIGEVNKFFSCKSCKKKVTINEMERKNIKCLMCKKTSRIKELPLSIMVSATFLDKDKKETSVTFPKDVLSTLLPDITSANEDAVTDCLLELCDVNITYNPKTMMVSKITQDSKKNEEDKENMGDILKDAQYILKDAAHSDKSDQTSVTEMQGGMN